MNLFERLARRVFGEPPTTHDAIIEAARSYKTEPIRMTAKCEDIEPHPWHNWTHPIGAPVRCQGVTPAPEPEPTRTVVTQTRGPIGSECNTGGHYDCQGCGCGCHPPEVIAQLAALSKTVGTAEATRIMTRRTT